MQLLPKWTEIDVDDALELLGPSFDNPTIRTYAVDRLRKADDEVSLIPFRESRAKTIPGITIVSAAACTSSQI